MNITIFGANGGIGKIVTELTINSGYNVTAVVRPNGAPIEIIKKADKVIHAELTQKGLIDKAIKKADIVINMTGPALNMSRKLQGTPIADGLQNIVDSMKKFNKKRLIVIGTPTLSSHKDKSNLTTVLPNVMAKILYPNAYREMKKMKGILYSSDLDWTVVRFINPNVKNKGKGYDFVLGERNGKLGVSRFNIASFIIEQALQDRFIKEMPIVFNK